MRCFSKTSSNLSVSLIFKQLSLFHEKLCVLLDVSVATTVAKSGGLSTGALIGILIPVVFLVVLIIAVIVYKCRKPSYYGRGNKLMAGKPTRFSELKSRFGKTTEVPYQEDID